MFTAHIKPKKITLPQRHFLIYSSKRTRARASAVIEIAITKMLKNIVLPLLKKSEPFAGLQKVNIYINI